MFITTNELEKFDRSVRDGSYVCRECGNGSGESGTGLTPFTMYDGITQAYYCQKCRSLFVVREGTPQPRRKKKWFTHSDVLNTALEIDEKRKKEILYDFLKNRKLSKIVDVPEFNQIFANVVFLSNYVAFPLKNLRGEIVDFKIFLRNDNHIKLNTVRGTQKQRGKTGFITDFVLYPNKPIFIVESIINALTCVFFECNAISIDSCSKVCYFDDIVKRYYGSDFNNFVLMLDKNALTKENSLLVGNCKIFDFGDKPSNYDINDLFIDDYERCAVELEQFNEHKKKQELQQRYNSFICSDDVDQNADINVMNAHVGSGKTTFISSIFQEKDMYLSNTVDAIRDFADIVSEDYLYSQNKDTYDYTSSRIIATHERLSFGIDVRDYFPQKKIRELKNVYIDEYDTLFNTFDIELARIYRREENELYIRNIPAKGSDVFLKFPNGNYFLKNNFMINKKLFFSEVNVFFGSFKKEYEIIINGNSLSYYLTGDRRRNWVQSKINKNIFFYPLKTCSLSEMKKNIKKEYEQSLNGFFGKSVAFSFNPILISCFPLDQNNAPVFFDDFCTMAADERVKLKFSNISCSYFSVFLRGINLFWLVRLLAEKKKIFFFSGTKNENMGKIFKWLTDERVSIHQSDYDYVRKKYNITVFRTDKNITSHEIRVLANHEIMRENRFIFFAKNDKIAERLYKNSAFDCVFFKNSDYQVFEKKIFSESNIQNDVYNIFASSFSAIARAKNLLDYNIFFLDANIYFPKFLSGEKNIIEIQQDLYNRLEQLVGRVLRGDKKKILFFVYNDNFLLKFDNILQKYADVYEELIEKKKEKMQYYCDDIEMLIFKIMNDGKIERRAVIVSKKEETETEKKQRHFERLCQKIERYINENKDVNWSNIYLKFNLKRETRSVRELLKMRYC